MADYRAIANGNYSNLAIWEVWNGSAWVAATVLPQVGDDVYANGRTVTIDIDSFASSYRTTGITGVSASGEFVLNGGITAVGDVRSGGTRCMTHSAASDSFVVGDCFGSMEGGTGTNRAGLSSYSTGTLHVVGDAYNGGGAATNTSTGNHGVQGRGSGSFVLYGNANGFLSTPGTTTRHCAAFSLPPHIGRVYGRARGVSGNQTFGAENCEVNECASFNSNCIVTGAFIHDTNNNLQGLVNCRAKVGAAVQVVIFDEAGDPITLNPLFAQGQADQSDVRQGTIYANGALTGTLAVPPAAAVSLGVPVDDTVGTMPTAAVIASDLLNELSTSSNALAERLRNVATVETTGTQISALQIIP